jgi:hypothetical protein
MAYAGPAREAEGYLAAFGFHCPSKVRRIG